MESYLRQNSDIYYSNINRENKIYIEWFSQWWGGKQEIARLAEAGVTPFVIRDAFAQVQFNQLGWTRQKKVLLTRDWMIDLHLKWLARKDAAEYTLKIHIPNNSTYETAFTSWSTIRRIFQPLCGLVHIPDFNDMIRPNDKLQTKINETLLDIKTGGKEWTLPISEIKKISSEYYKNELKTTLELYPNMKMIFMVRDPRSFVSARLRRVHSLQERQNKFYCMLDIWHQMNSELIGICDSFPGRCHIIRHEDLILRPEKTMEMLVKFKLRLPIKSIVYEGYEKEVGYSLTHWSKYLPPGTESILVDQNRLLNRLGYNPLITNETQYSEIDLSPKGDPLTHVDLANIQGDLYSMNEDDLRNI